MPYSRHFLMWKAFYFAENHDITSNFFYKFVDL
jgi:hypothetical protein